MKELLGVALLCGTPIVAVGALTASTSDGFMLGALITAGAEVMVGAMLLGAALLDSP